MRGPPAQAFGLAAVVFGLLPSALRLHTALALAGRDSDISELALRWATPQAVGQHLAELELAGVRREHG